MHKMSTASNKPAVTQAAPQTTPQVTPQTAPQATPQTAPPEAYAAFVRIYMKWMGIDQDESKDLQGDEAKTEQYGLVRENVILAQKIHNTFISWPEFPKYGPFGKPGSILYEDEFDEYVNGTWIKFSEEFEDLDKFVNYLQKQFEKNMENGLGEYLKKCQLKFNKMRKNFYNKVVAEWESKAETMNDEDFKNYMAEEQVKRKAEYDKMKKDFEIESMIIYPPLRKLILRSVLILMNQKRRNRISSKAKFVSLDVLAEDEEGGTTTFELEDKKADGRVIEEYFAKREVIVQVFKGLSAQDKKIFVRRMNKVTMDKIANELGMSKGTVSKRFTKIKDKLQEQLDIPLDDKDSKQGNIFWNLL